MDQPGTIAVTDRGWYDFLRGRPELREVNFWKPSPRRTYRAAELSPFLFKLKAPDNAICGFGFFARYSRLPPWLAWEAFGEGNGCVSLAELQQRLAAIRERIRYKAEAGPDTIGCILLVEPVFFSPEDWVRPPSDWPVRTQTHKSYDLGRGEGARVWRECLDRATLSPSRVPVHPGLAAERGARYGTPYLVEPRIGQGVFRVAVTEAYGSACSITNEHSLPALEACHIRPFADGGPHRVSNGLLLRADLHRLFDRGYLTVTPDGITEVSSRLRSDFQNGHCYYPLHGTRLRLPPAIAERPDPDFLSWHNEQVFAA